MEGVNVNSMYYWLGWICI